MKFIDRIMRNQFYRKYRETFMMLIDLMIVIFSYFVAVWTKESFSMKYLEDNNIGTTLIIACVIITIYFICFLFFKINRSLWKYISIRESFIIAVANVVALFIISLLFVSITGNNYKHYISIGVIATLLIILCMFGIRVTYRLFRKHSLFRPSAKKTLIIGAGDAGSLLSRELVQNSDIGLWPVGFIDDYKKGKIVYGLEVYGGLDDLQQVVSKQQIEVIVIAIPSLSKGEIRKIYEKCQLMELPIKIMNDINYTLEDGLLRKRNPVQDIKLEDLLGRGEVKFNQNDLESYLYDKVVCVTGAGGSIGSELCRQIVNFDPKKMILIDINENGLYMLEQEFIRNKMHAKLDKEIEIISYIASIRDKKAIDEIFAYDKPNVVFHAAAHKHVPLMETRPMEAIKNNVFGTNNVIHSCIENKVERFILISTDKAVNPTNVMGATKRMTEMILQSLGDNGITKMAAVRFGNVLGSNGSVIPIFNKQIENGGPITLTSKEIIRYFMTIPEATQLVLQAGSYANNGEIFMLDMGEPVKILDLAEKMIRLSGYDPYVDIDIIEIGLRPGEKMFEELHFYGEKKTRTENELIFKLETMKINQVEVNEKLQILLNKLNNNCNTSEYREIMLKLIVND